MRLIKSSGAFFFTVLIPCLVVAMPAFGQKMNFHVLEKTALSNNLAHHPVWLKLLQYDHSGDKSEVLNEDFFLSVHGRIDPEAELRATLEAFFSHTQQKGDDSARCRFPARYAWLTDQLDLSPISIQQAGCTKLIKWSRLDSITSVSVLLVSGYFGNPASSFGHSLLRLNSKDSKQHANLLDLTFNFGALVPENEIIPLYIYRGLTGGYQSGFSDRYFYTEDMVYSRTEYRDVWEYELKLTKKQQHLLIFHLWEIIGKKFTYYFLTENCAYRISELLELATGETFLEHTHVWYPPMELFLRLHEIDRREKKKLINRITFSPSEQRILYDSFRLLNESERKSANAVIRDGVSNMQGELKKYSWQSQARIVNALLAYYQFKVNGQQPEPDKNLLKKKDDVLRARLQLPAQSNSKQDREVLPSPASGAGLVRTGFGLETVGNKTLGVFNWSAHHQGLLDGNGQTSGELVTSDIHLTIDQDVATLRAIDFLRIRKFNETAIPVYGEEDWSWEVRVGMQQRTRIDKDADQFVLTVGMGDAAKITDHAFAYWMLDVTGETAPDTLVAAPNLGLVYVNGPWRAWLRTGVEYRDSQPDKKRSELDFEYGINRKYALLAQGSWDDETRITLQYLYYW